MHLPVYHYPHILKGLVIFYYKMTQWHCHNYKESTNVHLKPAPSPAHFCFPRSTLLLVLYLNATEYQQQFSSPDFCLHWWLQYYQRNNLTSGLLCHKQINQALDQTSYTHTTILWLNGCLQFNQSDKPICISKMFFEMLLSLKQ